jgi:serine/threonine protein kinase
VPCPAVAPEIYEEQPYSYKSDVWALGCVMYEMLTGKPAFAADNLSRVVIRVRPPHACSGAPCQHLWAAC